jgi:peptide deformylase
MTVRDILLYAEHQAGLRQKCQPVRALSRRARTTVRALKDTLTAHPEGAGLAAPQIGVHSRIVVVRLSGGADSEDPLSPPLALINPVVLEAHGKQRDFDGCLSFPGLYGETVRPHYLRVSGLDEAGRPFDRVFQGFDAVVVHHEIDHLDGILFIDRIESIDDLYRVRRDEDGDWVRVPLSVALPS